MKEEEKELLEKSLLKPDLFKVVQIYTTNIKDNNTFIKGFYERK